MSGRGAVQSGALAVLVVGLLLSLSGCGPVQKVEAVEQSPIAQVVLKANRNKLVEVADDTDPQAGAIVLVAVISVNLADYKIKQVLKKLNTTVLEVNQTIHGKSRASIFSIDTTRELQVAMNGKFVEQVGPHEIIINVVPNSNSQIVISDAHAGDHVYRKGSVKFLNVRLFLANAANKIIGNYSAANFDTGGNENLPHKDAEMLSRIRHLGERFTTVNGTKVAVWSGGDQPSLSTCESLPSSQYVTTIDASAGSLFAHKWSGNWCLRTSQGHYGALHGRVSSIFSLDAFIYFDYVVWQKPTRR